MSEAHAKLSPSGAHKWMACPGSVAMESQIADRPTIWSQEGTAAHELGSKMLISGAGKSDAEALIGTETILVGDHEWPITQEMVDAVWSYVKLVREYAGDTPILVEQRLSFSETIGVPDQFGTSDAVILKGDEIIVVDLKYGMGVRVDAEENEQAQLYALGVLEEYGFLGDFKMVSMVICQPRLNHVSEWVIPVAELRAFGETAKKAAAVVLEAIAQADDPDVTDRGEYLYDAMYLFPGEDQCRFCRAKATCPALRATVLEIVSEGSVGAAMFEDLTDGVTALLDNRSVDYIASAMGKVGLVEDWCKAIRAETERRLFDGQDVTGFKLVAGRQGARKWIDEKDAEAAFKSFRLKQEEMYDFSLISPTTAEKLLKDKSPKRWDRVSKLVTRADGKPSVAPVTDKRPAITVGVVAGVFDDISAD